jgi:carboxypeptidase family protein
MFPKSLVLSFIGLLLATFSVWAGTSALEGVVNDPAGHPVKGADVRIEATNGSSFSRIIKTDAAGHYTSGGLAVGIYKVTVIVNGTVKASMLNAYTQSAKPTELNFELTQKRKVVKTHRVWIAAETGTHIGGGTWVDVDDNGNIVSPSGANNSGVSSIDKLGAFRPTIRTARPPGE